MIWGCFGLGNDGTLDEIASAEPCGVSRMALNMIIFNIIFALNCLWRLRERYDAVPPADSCASRYNAQRFAAIWYRIRSRLFRSWVTDRLLGGGGDAKSWTRKGRIPRSWAIQSLRSWAQSLSMFDFSRWALPVFFVHWENSTQHKKSNYSSRPSYGKRMLPSLPAALKTIGCSQQTRTNSGLSLVVILSGRMKGRHQTVRPVLKFAPPGRIRMPRAFSTNKKKIGWTRLNMRTFMLCAPDYIRLP